MAEIYSYRDHYGVHHRTREDILTSYYSVWKDQMEKRGAFEKINEDNCIRDWCAANHAERKAFIQD